MTIPPRAPSSADEPFPTVETPPHHFGPIDLDALRLSATLSVGQRVERWLSMRRLVVDLIRGRLRRIHPNLSEEELTLKLLEELECAGRRFPPPL